jgi:HSP20 family molecular chaperone IbpA
MFNSIFDEFYTLTKPTNLLQTYHTDESTVCVMDLPGYNKDNLKVELKDETLLIEGKLSISIDGLKSPIKTHSISKTYTVGSKYDYEKVSAEVKDGILTIILPFKNEKKNKVISLLS